jgi:hypothetical protein
MNPARKFDGQVSVGRGGDKVEARTVDSFRFSDVSLIKIDVEGHELKVLRGAEKTISTFHPVIIIEIWVNNVDFVLPLLASYGYTARAISAIDYVATYGSEP